MSLLHGRERFVKPSTSSVISKHAILEHQQPTKFAKQ